MSDILTREQALEIYYYLRLNRRFEEALARLFRQNKIVGGLYGSLGQEAISVGSAYALGPGDWIAPMIRNIGALLVRGFGPAELFAQFMGRAESPTRGKDNGSHVADLKVRHVVAPTSMLGDLIPVMTGLAMAGRYLGQKIVALTWIGDGGSSTGAFHEGLNFAAAQKAPLVVILENNQWAYSTPVDRQVPLRDLAERARAYGMASGMVDGNDVEAVFRATSEAAAYAREGRGPFLLEAKTMRMTGHAQHDGAEYVPRAMLEYWKARDPLERYERKLRERQVLDAAVKSEIDARIARELAAGLAEAESLPFPAPESAAQGVYCEGCHSIAADWQRPREELLPPKSGVVASWAVEDFGAAGGGAGAGENNRGKTHRATENSAARNAAELPRPVAPEPER
jgi:TPP-dependent pyruvate/acetoin dehydrogenase alpha subunit